MAKGESTFSSAGRQVVRFENKPIAQGDYGLELLETGMEVKRSEEKGPDAIPYVNTRMGAQGTAAKEGQKDRLVFVPFYLSLKPGKDGVIGPDRGGGIVEYLRANGRELDDCPVLELKKSDGTTETYLDPEHILGILQDMTGAVTQGHVRIEAAKDRQGKLIPGAPGKNKVDHWLVEETAPEEDQEEVPAKPVGKKSLPSKGKK